MLALTLGVAVGVPLLLLAWAKILQLLNDRSDASVLLGLSLLIVTFVLVGLTVFLLLRKFFDWRTTGHKRDAEQQSQSDVVEPKSLFSESANTVENLYEDRRTKNSRE